MDRRLFLRNAALLTTGIVAADQLEILERLTWKRKYFAGHDFRQDYVAIIFRGNNWVIDLRDPDSRDLSNSWLDAYNAQIVELKARTFIPPGSIVKLDAEGYAVPINASKILSSTPVGQAYMSYKR